MAESREESRLSCGSDFSLLARSFHVEHHRIPSLVLRVSQSDCPHETVWASQPYEMVHIIHWDDNNIWWGSFKRGVANCPLSLELSQCFPCQLCFLPPPKCGWGHPLPIQERCFPLESRLPLCFDSDHNAWEWLFLPSLGTEGVGELRGKSRLIILVVSQPAMFSK